jgi:hypothetical protein
MPTLGKGQTLNDWKAPESMMRALIACSFVRRRRHSLILWIIGLASECLHQRTLQDKATLRQQETGASREISYGCSDVTY